MFEKSYLEVDQQDILDKTLRYKDRIQHFYHDLAERIEVVNDYMITPESLGTESKMQTAWNLLRRITAEPEYGVSNFFVLLGGSMIFGDPRNWDFDIVIICLEGYDSVGIQLEDRLNPEWYPLTQNPGHCTAVPLYEELESLKELLSGDDISDNLEDIETLMNELSFAFTGYLLHSDSSTTLVTIREAITDTISIDPLLCAMFIRHFDSIIQNRMERKQSTI